MKPLYLIAEIHPHPEKLDQAKKAFDELVTETIKEPGCLLYDLVIEQGSDSWLMVEKWESKTHWEAHMETEHVKKINELASDFVTRETKLRFLHPVATGAAISPK